MFHRAQATSVGDCVYATRPKFKKREPASDESCHFDGTVEGTLNYPKFKLTIGENGRVTSDVRARIVIVEGTVEGDIYGSEAVYLCRRAHVFGNIESPRFSIEDGAVFNGRIKQIVKDAISVA